MPEPTPEQLGREAGDAESGPPIYRCTFDRIGRNHDVGSHDFAADDAQALADVLYNFCRRFCASSEVEVLINFEEGRGRVIVGGFRPAGEFTIEAVDA